MGNVLVVVVLAMVVMAGICIGLVAGVLHWLAVRNRVVAGRKAEAPLRWLVSPRAAARLHRRLRAAMSAAASCLRARGIEDLGLGGVVSELEDRAVELDLQLVIADRAPTEARRRMLRELQAETTEIERLVERVLRMRRAWSGGLASERGLGAVRERLDLLESALRELDGLEVHRPVTGPSTYAVVDPAQPLRHAGVADPAAGPRQATG